MFYRVRELELRKIHFDVSFAPGEIDFDSSLKQVGPLQAAGTVELISSLLSEIRIEGRVQVHMHASCDRCLEPIEAPLNRTFDLLYRPMEAAPTGEEVEIDPVESEMGFYEGDGLDLKDVVREQVLLWLPMQQVCREDCKGICPTCGQNRNQIACACQPKPVDDRWAALKAITTRPS